MGFRAAVLIDAPTLACPACRARMVVAHACSTCGREFPTVAGMPDLRLRSDRYLSLAEEREKAERLAVMAEHLDFSTLTHAYYDMTDDVDVERRQRFCNHIANAEIRGRILAELLPNRGRVLEVGCGTGGLLVAASKLKLAIEGADIASRWLVLARKRMEARGVEMPLWVAGAERLPWPDATFDTVVADSLVEHLDDPAVALREWLRVVKPNGKLILWSPNRYSLMLDPHVGLFGLGFLPRRLQTLYVRLRRKCDWTVRPLAGNQVVRLVREAGWKRIQIQAAAAPSNRFADRAYNRLRSSPIAKTLLLKFGPLWQVVAEKGAA